MAEKALRDEAAGKGFRRQLLTGEENGCGVIGRGYAKARSTEPFIVSPWNPQLSRLMSKTEHAGVKAAPVSLVEGVSETIAHEILGQSVSYAAVVAVGVLIAKTVKGLVQPLMKSKVVNQEAKATPVEPSKEKPAKQDTIAPATMPLFALTA